LLLVFSEDKPSPNWRVKKKNKKNLKKVPFEKNLFVVKMEG